MFDGNFRPQVEAKLKPVGQQIKRTGITADHLTIAGLVMAVGAAVVISFGWWHLGLLFVVLTGVPDLLDGAVAKASGTAGPRGAFFDSVSDRVTDALLFGAIAINYSQNQPNWVWLPVAVLASASWVSYIRAKAESLGFDASGGMVERAERFIILLVALLFPMLMIPAPVSYTHLRAHETVLDLVCRLLLEKKKHLHLSHQSTLPCRSTSTPIL